MENSSSSDESSSEKFNLAISSQALPKLTFFCAAALLLTVSKISTEESVLSAFLELGTLSAVLSRVITGGVPFETEAPLAGGAEF